MPEQIRLVGEDQAQGRVREIYRDVRRTMGVPYVGDVFRAFAALPPFLEVVWWEIKPLIGTVAFEGLADRLRAHAIACARQHLFVPDHTRALEERGLGDSEIGRIRDLVEVFYQTDPRLLVIAAAVDQSLTTGPVGTNLRGNVPRRSIAPLPPGVSPTLISPAEAPESAQPIFDDVRATLGMPFVVADLRSLAQWPDYVRLTWDDLKGQLRSAQFRRNAAELHNIAMAGLRDLPRVVRVDVTAVRGAGVEQRQLSQVCDLAALFARLSPSLVLAIALVRLGLNSMLEHQLLELEASA